MDLQTFIAFQVGWTSGVFVAWLMFEHKLINMAKKVIEQERQDRLKEFN
jgi:hypothetical protein